MPKPQKFNLAQKKVGQKTALANQKNLSRKRNQKSKQENQPHQQLIPKRRMKLVEGEEKRYPAVVIKLQACSRDQGHQP